MDAVALRNWGLTAGAALLATSLTLALAAGDPQPAPPPERATVAAPLPPVEHVAPTAQAEEPPVELSFLVHFNDVHPLGHAQELASRGRDAAARRAAETELTQREFRGLCLDHFTLGGAEIVLKTCDLVPAAEAEATRSDWLQRLQAMPDLAYAELNAVAAPDAAPP